MAIRVTNVTAQTLFESPEIFRSLTDPISFSHEPFARKIRVANFTVQVLQLDNGQFRVVPDEIRFGQHVAPFMVYQDRQVISDPISFSDVAVGFNIADVKLSDLITFFQTVRVSPILRSLSHIMNLNDGAAFCFATPHQAIEIIDTLGIQDHVSLIPPILVTDFITFLDFASNTTFQEQDFIEFVQTVAVGKGLTDSDIISFSQLITTSHDFVRVVEDANFIEHSMTYYIDNGCNRKQYARFIGEGSAPVIPPQRLVFNANMALESISTNDLLILRNPETDDNDRLGFSRINRETRGGELNVFADPNWAEVNTLLFTITALADGTRSQCPDVINTTLEFFQSTLGEEIFLHDWTGTSWRGVVTTPNEVATEDSDGWWTLAFEFEGTEQDGSVPNNNLVIQDSFSVNWDRLRAVSDSIDFTEVVRVRGSIRLSVSDTLNFTEDVSGSVETTLLFHNLGAGSAIDLEGTSPDTGSGTWRAHEEYQEDGTMTAPVNSGAYYAFTPVDGFTYLATFGGAHVVTYNDANNCIWGFFEGISANDTIVGARANGQIDPTTAKAVHLMRETGGGTRNNAYRQGNNSDGEFSTLPWTDSGLNSDPDDVLDLRITLDTTGGVGNWTALWEAKDLLDGTYTEVGPVTNLPSENVGAIGFSNDSGQTELTTSTVRLLRTKTF